MEYNKPQISTMEDTPETQGTFVWTETVLLGVAYGVVAVVISQIDLTP